MAQLPKIEDEYDRQKWYVGEQIGKDPRGDAEAERIVSDRLSRAILSGMGAEMRRDLDNKD